MANILVRIFCRKVVRFGMVDLTKCDAILYFAPSRKGGLERAGLRLSLLPTALEILKMFQIDLRFKFLKLSS